MSVIDPKTTKTNQDNTNNEEQTSMTPTLGRSSSFTTGTPAPTQKGSGRFTNLQKYISSSLKKPQKHSNNNKSHRIFDIS